MYDATYLRNLENRQARPAGVQPRLVGQRGQGRRGSPAADCAFELDTPGKFGEIRFWTTEHFGKLLGIMRELLVGKSKCRCLASRALNNYLVQMPEEAEREEYLNARPLN